MTLSAAGRRGLRRGPLLVAAGIAMVVALVPLGLKTGDGNGKAARQAMGDAGRGPMND